jgi:hypothetical protein
VCAGTEPANVREVQVLRDEKSPGASRGLPDTRVWFSGEPFPSHVIHFVAEGRQFAHQRFRQILVQLDFRAAGGTDGTGISSSADAAAKAMTARNASPETVGKSAKISSCLAAPDRLASNVRAVTRVAWWLRQRTTVRLRWLSERLWMGHLARVSQAFSQVKHHPDHQRQQLQSQLAKAGNP